MQGRHNTRSNRLMKDEQLSELSFPLSLTSFPFLTPTPTPTTSATATTSAVAATATTSAVAKRRRTKKLGSSPEKPAPTPAKRQRIAVSVDSSPDEPVALTPATATASKRGRPSKRGSGRGGGRPSARTSASRLVILDSSQENVPSTSVQSTAEQTPAVDTPALDTPSLATPATLDTPAPTPARGRQARVVRTRKKVTKTAPILPVTTISDSSQEINAARSIVPRITISDSSQEPDNSARRPNLSPTERDSQFRERQSRVQDIDEQSLQRVERRLATTSSNAQRQRAFRQRQSVLQAQALRLQNTLQMRAQRSQMTPEQAEEIRQQDVEQHRTQRSQMTPEQAEEIQLRNTQQHRTQRSQMSAERVGSLRQQRAQQMRTQRAQETPEHAAERKRKDAERHRLARAQAKIDNFENTRARYANYIEANRDLPYDMRPRFNEDQVMESNLGGMCAQCEFCLALHFKGERPKTGLFTICCRKGRLRLPSPLFPYPSFMRDALMNPQNRYYQSMTTKTRNYNNALAFTSLGANIITPPGFGPYCFKVSGQTFHKMATTIVPGEPNLSYCQLYFLDSSDATDARMLHDANVNLSRELMQEIDYEIRSNNEYAKFFKTVQEMMKDNENEIDKEHEKQVNEALLRGEDPPEKQEPLNYKLIFNKEYQMQDCHQGRQNAPTAHNEVAAVFELGNEGVPDFYRDFHVYARPGTDPNDPRLQNLYPESPHIDPMTYPLLFPYGETGYCRQFTSNGYFGDPSVQTHFTQLQYKQSLLQVRPSPYRPILHARNLFQQYAVDSYCLIEASNLNWLKMHQDTIQAQRYVSVHQAAARLAAKHGLTAAPTIILPSAFQGSARHMRQQCNDAMATFTRYGRPDYFTTMTCNPNWPEIQKELEEGQSASDRPDIVARVFKLKLDEMLNEIQSGLFGPVLCMVHTIEFQKRGLPHAHILFTIQNGHKPDNAETINKYVCAELPDRELNPRLFDIVTKTMTHGPCRQDLCIVDGKCSKNFPKKYSNETIITNNDYPLYRRRDMPPEKVTQRNKEVSYTNAYVVPYNAYLSLKYNCHINVEVVTQMRSSIKYIYKYVFKGFDVMSVKIVNGVVQNNEINNYLNCRYVSAPEAIWRMQEFPMHDRTHAVIRLPIHLENAIELTFDGGLEIAPEVEERTLTTMLEAYFVLNATDSNAHQYLYAQIPEHYVFNAPQRRWNPRQQRGDRVIGRIHDVGVLDKERFALRLLLLNVPGATSFADIRKVNGRQYKTFQEAAQMLNLIRNDDAYTRAFENMAAMKMPAQFRDAFANMLITFTIRSAKHWWDCYKSEMIEDFRRMPQFANCTTDELYNLALHSLNQRFAALNKGVSNETFALPKPKGDLPDFNAATPIHLALQNIVLNPAQQLGFDKIMSAVQASIQKQPHQRLYFVNGPGGSGKTTLYRSIIDACKTLGLSARVYATTGIAATLMPGGLTVHRGFGLPLNMNHQSVSNFINNLQSAVCTDLAKTDVFLIDEVTMMVKHGINIIDNLLRAVTNVNEPFGGKVIVFGGDFRQLLPVVPRGSRAEIVTDSVLGSKQWRNVEVISLTQNMRAQGDQQFGQWLLKLGTGSLPTVYNNDPNIVEIPPHMLLQLTPQEAAAAVINNRTDSGAIPVELRAMIRQVFGDDINKLTREDLTSRSILLTSLKAVLKVNNHMIATLNGPAHTYLSVDDIISDDDNDKYNFPVEYLNNQMVSGIPPHALTLKVGAVILLLRNIDPEKGLSNGTRLIVIELKDSAIVAEIISESHRGSIVFIFRMDLVTEDSMIPVKMRRQQFPVIPAFAMTVNKAQGQSIEILGIYLNDVVFSHGQLYVAFSRSRDSHNIKIFIKDQGTQQGHLMRNVPGQQHRVFTRNVVYREVFLHGELDNTPNLETLDPELAAIINQNILDEIQEKIALEEDEVIRQLNIDALYDIEDDDEEGNYNNDLPLHEILSDYEPESDSEFDIIGHYMNVINYQADSDSTPHNSSNSETSFDANSEHSSDSDGPIFSPMTDSEDELETIGAYREVPIFTQMTQVPSPSLHSDSELEDDPSSPDFRYDTQNAVNAPRSPSVSSDSSYEAEFREQCLERGITYIKPVKERFFD